MTTDFAYVAGTSSTSLSLAALSARIVDFAGRLSSTMCRWLLLVAEFDARGGPESAGLSSTSEWLAFHCGVARRTASEHVRVARMLRAHENLAAEMAAGRLSYSQARAISRVVTPDDTTLVHDLIEVARHGTVAQLEVIVRGLRTVEDNERLGDRDEREYVTHGYTSESMWRLSARLDPERGAVVAAAIERFAAVRGISAADALVELAETALAALADTATDTRREPRRLRGHERTAVVVHIDADRVPPAIGIGSAEPIPASAPQRRVPVARLDRGPGLPDRVVARLICSGRVRAVVHGKAGSVLDVGRSQRLVTDRQYRALLIRHRGHCGYPGCTSTHNLEAHHVVHWINGGRTDLDNLLLLCERHHVTHHEGAFSVIGHGCGRFSFLLADGRELSSDRADVVARSRGAAGRIAIDSTAADAASTRWDGQRLDRHYAVSVLAIRREQSALRPPGARPRE
jgi:hypothetical protein